VKKDQDTEYVTFKENQARQSEKETKGHPLGFPLPSPVLATDLKKRETEARFILPLLKNRNQKCGVNKIESLISDKYWALEEKLDVEGGMSTNHSL